MRSRSVVKMLSIRRPLWIHASPGVPTPPLHPPYGVPTGKCVTPYTPISDRFSRNRRMRGCRRFAELLVPLLILSDSLDFFEIWPGRRKNVRSNKVSIATPEKKYAQWAFSFSKKKETLTLCHGCGEGKSDSRAYGSNQMRR